MTWFYFFVCINNLQTNPCIAVLPCQVRSGNNPCCTPLPTRDVPVLFPFFAFCLLNQFSAPASISPQLHRLVKHYFLLITPCPHSSIQLFIYTSIITSFTTDVSVFLPSMLLAVKSPCFFLPPILNIGVTFATFQSRGSSTLSTMFLTNNNIISVISVDIFLKHLDHEVLMIYQFLVSPIIPA